MIPAAITVVAIAGLGVWAFWSRPKAPSTPARAATSVRSLTHAGRTSTVCGSRHTEWIETPSELDIPTPKVVPIERTLRPLVQWRTRDLVVERSTDGGGTWTTGTRQTDRFALVRS